jgi:hypothetical protein
MSGNGAPLHARPVALRGLWFWTAVPAAEERRLVAGRCWEVK